MKVINNEIYDMDLSDNPYVWKIKQEIPLVITFEYTLSKNNKMFLLDDIYDIVDKYSYEYLTEKFHIGLRFSLFRESETNKVVHLFLDNAEYMISGFILPFLEKLMYILYDDDQAFDNIFDNSNIVELFENISCDEDIDHLINIAKKEIDFIFEKINEKIESFEEWLIESYEFLGSLIQATYVFDNIKTPDKILEFDNKVCGIFRSRISTTYFLPNGI